jgi:ElaB/YqjD/DUF883 family membrane-anchored ribosome-binding protein
MSDSVAHAYYLLAQKASISHVFSTLRNDGIKILRELDKTYMPAPTGTESPFNLSPKSIVSDTMNPPPLNQPYVPSTPPTFTQMTSSPPPFAGQQPPAFMSQQNSQDDLSQIEDLIESIMEEKWKEVEGNILKMLEWKNKTQTTLEQMQQQITDINEDVKSLQQAIVGKVGEYDKNMLNVSAQLSAMEKAFSQVLPTFVENIHELDKITSRIKNTK